MQLKPIAEKALEEAASVIERRLSEGFGYWPFHGSAKRWTLNWMILCMADCVMDRDGFSWDELNMKRNNSTILKARLDMPTEEEADIEALLSLKAVKA